MAQFVTFPLKITHLVELNHINTWSVYMSALLYLHNRDTLFGSINKGSLYIIAPQVTISYLEFMLLVMLYEAMVFIAIILGLGTVGTLSFFE